MSLKKVKENNYGLENRKYKRIKLFPVTVKLVNGNLSYYGFIVDLSETGIKICLHYEMEHMDQLSLIIDLSASSDAEKLTIEAQQVWIDSISNLDHMEIGYQFKNIQKHQKKQLIQLMLNLEL